MMKIIDAILSSSYFAGKPPVVIDIGASGEINAIWKPIAKYSVCLAFDADDREFAVSDTTGTAYKRLVRFNRIVTATQKEQASFYLTASPFCSSLLPPETARLDPWVFRSLFRVDREVTLPAMTIQQALEQAGIGYIDWFKADTQGTDLQLFLSLPEQTRSNVLACELEPGIIDAYQGEDKLYVVMQAMKEQGFWLSAMQVKGTQRLQEKYAAKWGELIARNTIVQSPCWAELTYLHEASFSSERACLLLFIFALLQKQYGFALEVCDAADRQFSDGIFATAREAVLAQLKKERLRVPLTIVKRKIRKLFQ